VHYKTEFIQSLLQAYQLPKREKGILILSGKEHSSFDVHVTVHRDKCLITKPTRCTNFSNFIFGKKL